MGAVVKAKVGEMEENTREGRSRRTRKEVVGCVQDVVGKKNFLGQFKDRQKKEISSVSLTYVCSKEEICLEIDEPISDLPQKEQGGFLNIDGYPVVESASMFERGMFFSVFYFLCYVKEISTDMSEEQVLEERDSDLNEEEDIIMADSWGEHWGDVAEDVEDKSNMHALRWDVYTKEKEGLIKRDFSVVVPHPKGRKIVWTCVKDNIIG